MTTSKALTRPQTLATAPRSPIPEKFSGLITVREAVEELETFIKSGLLEPGKDYGILPGTDKYMLFKPGCEMLLNYFGFVVEQEVDDSRSDFSTSLYRYRVKTIGYKMNKETGVKTQAGIGWATCSSLESKYRYRWIGASELPSEIKSQCKAMKTNRKTGELYEGTDTNKALLLWKEKYGESAIKWKRKGSFQYPAFRVENPYPDDQENTILKMACNRSLRAFTLLVTGADRVFISGKELEALGIKRMPDEDDFTKTGELATKDIVEDAEFEEIPEEPVKDTATKTKATPAAARKATEPPKKANGKASVMEWEEFSKKLEPLCIKVGFAYIENNRTYYTSGLAKLIEGSYPGCKLPKDLSNKQRPDLINKLLDLSIQKEEDAKQRIKAAAEQKSLL